MDRPRSHMVLSIFPKEKETNTQQLPALSLKTALIYLSNLGIFDRWEGIAERRVGLAHTLISGIARSILSRRSFPVECCLHYCCTSHHLGRIASGGCSAAQDYQWHRS